MEKKTKMPLIYGYIVCIIAIITFIITIAGIISNIIDASDPLHTYGNDQYLSSFENFKMHNLNTGKTESNYIPDDDTLRTMYLDEMNYKIGKVKHNTTKAIVTNGIIWILSIVLFITHWQWIKKAEKNTAEI